MEGWETVNKNHYKDVACELQKFEIPEGTLYRHIMSVEGPEHVYPQIQLVFVESKKESG